MSRLGPLVVAARVAACVNGGRPPELYSKHPTNKSSAHHAHDSLDPNALAGCRGQQVSLSVTIGQDGVLHLHGYELAKEVRSGQTATFDFLADQSGQFVIELHNATHPSGLALGIFTVYEP
jgi:hypothetical protein